MTGAASPVLMSELVRRALMLADQAVIADIESEGFGMHFEGMNWYDVRPMLDEREHSLQVIDMAREALEYARQRGLIARHPDHSHLVRIVRQH